MSTTSPTIEVTSALLPGALTPSHAVERSFQQAFRLGQSHCVQGLTSPEKINSTNKSFLHKESTTTRPGSCFSHQSNHKLGSKIHKQFQKMSKANQQIKNYLKNIALQIKTDLLNTPKASPEVAHKPSTSAKIGQEGRQIAEQETRNVFKVVEERQAFQQSQFEGLLRPLVADNDVESDQEDIERGLNYVYGEFLYSVGEQIAQKRKVQGQRQQRAWGDNDKENRNIQNQQMQQDNSDRKMTRQQVDNLQQVENLQASL